MSQRYEKSENYLERALRVIPLASQTFSKSVVQYPFGVSPFFLERGEGAKVWDIDGNEYMDFINALLCVNLGYQDKDVDEAVMAQLKNGVSFSLPHRLETEVAELIRDIVPCSEMVRFAKNGSDATSGAIRIARAFTKRDHVVVCGYHGWQDWYIASTTRDEGIPSDTKKLTHKFNYNDVASLEKVFTENPDKIAAVIMEPMNVEYPKDGFLESVKELTHKNGAILIFDETVTGFRFANGGAQEFFGVTPDLATFGKGLANGYPLSAVTGRADIMKKMEDVFFSGTFGGETLSLAAAKAVIKKMLKENVIDKIYENGKYLIEQLTGLIERYEVGHLFEVRGHPAWSFIIMKDYNDMSSYDLKTFFMQTMHKNGFLTLGTHNLSYSHTKEDIDNLLKSYGEFFEIVKTLNSLSDLNKYLNCETLKPLFKVR